MAEIPPLPLDVLGWDEAARFLLRRTGASEHHTPDARKLADELGSLPLALEQAAAYMLSTGMTLPEYLRLCRQCRRELRERSDGDADPHASVRAAWRITVQRLGPDATLLLRVCAFFAPDQLAASTLALAFAIGDARDAARPNDPRLAVRFRAALREAAEFSMLSLNRGAVRMHRLVQAAIEHSVGADTRRHLAESAVRALDLAGPIPCYDNWPVWSRLLPHALVGAQIV